MKHHEIDADLRPRTVTLHFPQQHEEGVGTDFGFECPHSKGKVVQSCDDCGASMTMQFAQGAPESPIDVLTVSYRVVYELQIGVRLGNKQHKCDPQRNPACRAARKA